MTDEFGLEIGPSEVYEGRLEELLDRLELQEGGEYESPVREWDRPVPTPSTAPCPAPAQVARDRCKHPGTQTCPAIPNLLCLRDAAGTPFEYVVGTSTDPTTRLKIVTRRITPIVQKFIPPVRDALNSFVSNMSRFAMPIEAILTLGSLYCRCVTGSDRLSNHSFGDAIDVAGIRWPQAGGPASALRETIVHNWTDSGQRALLRRINACLRLSFKTVIDYHRSDHRDHFHCDTNARGGSVRAMGRSTTTPHFVQEALAHVLGRRIPETGAWDNATIRGLQEFSGVTPEDLRNRNRLNQVLDQLFTRVASDAPAASAARMYLEAPASSASAPPLLYSEATVPKETHYVRITLGREKPASPMTGIFVPQRYVNPSQVDLILYLQGHHEGAPQPPPNISIDAYWSARRYPYFAFREGVNTGKKNVILVAPTLGPRSEAGKLRGPGGLAWYLDQVLAALRTYGPFGAMSDPPPLGNIIIACHSGGGLPMLEIALTPQRYLDKVRQFWGFDCLYGKHDANLWLKWARENPSKQLFIHFGNGGTAARSLTLQGMAKSLPNVSVDGSKSVPHNHVPITHWHNRLRAARFLLDT